nr:MAG TPA: hypothetical protein [Bacteriophage sp.]
MNIRYGRQQLINSMKKLKKTRKLIILYLY